MFFYFFFHHESGPLRLEKTRRSKFPHLTKKKIGTSTKVSPTSKHCKNTTVVRKIAQLFRLRHIRLLNPLLVLFFKK